MFPELVLRQKYITNGGNESFPTVGSPGYEGGHTMEHFFNPRPFVNIGHDLYSIHTDNISNRLNLEEKFKQRPGIPGDTALATSGGNTYSDAVLQLAINKNRDFEVRGTNATSALVTLATDGGGILMTTAGASADQIIIAPTAQSSVSSWKETVWTTSKLPSFEAVIATAASIASVRIFAGLKLTATGVVATDDNQTFFRYDPADSANWQTADSASNTDNQVSSSVAVAASTKYHLRIQVDGNLIPRYYINGALVKVGTALTTAVNLIPFVGVHATTSAAKAMTLRYLACGRSLG